MKFLYNISVFLLELAFKILSLFNDKIKRGLQGRKQSLEIVQSEISKEDKVIWMHSASLGEYEQGLPVLEKLKEKFPTHKILVTFFSPSGYENVVKKQTIAEVVCYLPFDKKSTIKEFVSKFKTDIFFTVKYDFWYHLLDELKKNDSKIFVVSALFYPKQVYFKFYGKWFVQQLKKNVDWIFHQTKTSLDLAKSVGLTNGSVSGDTRFDRVKQIRNRDNSVEFISEFKADKKLVVFGSSWESEEKIAQILAEKIENCNIIIAPHNLKRVEHLQKIFPNANLYSELQTSNFQLPTSSILIIDCIGLLSKIYSYADMAVIGGGFHDKGLHNILEAATFGVPVIFGNKYQKNPEADELIANNGGRSFGDELAAANFVVDLLNNPEMLEKMGDNAANFVTFQPNSTEIILEKIVEM